MTATPLGRPIRVVVTGGRQFADGPLTRAALEALLAQHESLLVVHGGAGGLDAITKEWAEQAQVDGRAVRSVTVPADWTAPCRRTCRPGHRQRRPDGTTFCPAAGDYRNQRMLDEHAPDLLLVFPGNKATDEMRRRAEVMGVRIVDGLAAAVSGVTAASGPQLPHRNRCGQTPLDRSRPLLTFPVGRLTS